MIVIEKVAIKYSRDLPIIYYAPWKETLFMIENTYTYLNACLIVVCITNAERIGDA